MIVRKFFIGFLIFLVAIPEFLININLAHAIDDGRIAYHHTDHLTGSNVDTNKDGNVFEVIDYYPFGSVRVDNSYGGYENDYKYTGKELDEDTGLYYYGARYYDAGVGRFVSQDPAFLAVGTNKLEDIVKMKQRDYLSNPQLLNGYSYTANNPLKYTNPNGKFLFTASVAIYSLAVAYAPVWVPATTTAISAIGAGITSWNYGKTLGYYAEGDIKNAEKSGLNTMVSAGLTGAGVVGVVQAGDAMGACSSGQRENIQQSLQANDSWGNPDKLEGHFKKHGADFGANNHNDYANKASDFFVNSQSKNLPTKIDNGIIRTYDESTNTFGAYNSDGTTKTFFQPREGVNYWNRQPGTLIEQKGGGIWTP